MSGVREMGESDMSAPRNTCTFCDEQRDETVFCRYLNERIGWRHGASGLCPRCRRDPDHSAAVQQLIRKLRYLRVALWWHWDRQPRTFRHTIDLEAACTILRDEYGADVAGDALVDAVRHQMPHDEAEKLAKAVLPESMNP